MVWLKLVSEMIVDLELAGLVLCQLLYVVVLIWILVDGGFFEPKPTVVDLGGVDINGNWTAKRVYPEAGTGGFQEVVQGQGNVPVEGLDGLNSYFQREKSEVESEGAGPAGKESGRGIAASTLCRCEAKRSRYDKRSQEGPDLDHSELREYLERRARECGLFGHRVDD